MRSRSFKHSIQITSYKHSQASDRIQHEFVEARARSKQTSAARQGTSTKFDHTSVRFARKYTNKNLFERTHIHGLV